MSAAAVARAGAYEGRCHGCAATVVLFREFDDGPPLPDLGQWQDDARFAGCHVCGGQVTWSPAPNPGGEDRTSGMVLRAILDEVRSHDRRGECVCGLCALARDLRLLAGAR